MNDSALLSIIARSFLADELSAEAVRSRGAKTLGRDWPWLKPLAHRYVAEFSRRTRPRHREVIQFLRNDPAFTAARTLYRAQLSITEWLAEPPRMQPAAAAAHWNLPAIETVGDLADWLSLYPGELEWFADLKDINGKLHKPALEHYRYRIAPKRSGGVRVIEMPKANLKALQRRILSGILDRVPPHPAAHGFIKGRSIVSFAAPHTQQAVLLRVDLQDFFPTFPAARVQALFRTLGYPEPVADRLGGICTNAVPASVWKNCEHDISLDRLRDAQVMYARSHLPQGAASSPALANLTAYRLDRRLSGLAKCAGAEYTRYADDLAFSGGDQFSRNVNRFTEHAAAIAMEEGFTVNHHKTRVMRQSSRQQLAGIVVNKTTSLRRVELERLEATLTNCIRMGPGSQNRDHLEDFRAHLQGRVGFVEMVNKGKGRRLRELLDKVRWEGS